MKFDNPNTMRNFALQELRKGKEPCVSEKEKPKKSLRLILPSWLGGRAGKDLEKSRKDD